MTRLFKWFGSLALVAVLGLGIGFGLQLGESTLERSADSPRTLDQLGALTQTANAQTLPRVKSGPASARRTIIVDVAQQVSPAVVSIGAQKTTYVRETDPFGFDAYFPLYKLARRNFPYLGSGFIIDQEGHVLTNYHVVEDASTITVTLPDRRSFEAELLDADRYVDIALLKLTDIEDLAEPLPVVEFADSDNLLIGETVLAIGNPFGPLIADPRPSVSVGVISAVDRSFRPTRDARLYRNMIQTDAAINPGNSGGPLVTLDGEVIGINTFIFSRSGDSASVGFSIPINRARKIVDEIIEYGKVRSIWLDIEVLNLNPSIRQWLGLSVDSGALIKSLEIGGPAEQAGLQPGDVVTAADGSPVNNAEELLADIMSSNVGDEIELEVVRGDSLLSLTYTVTEAPTRRNTRYR